MDNPLPHLRRRWRLALRGCTLLFLLFFPRVSMRPRQTEKPLPLPRSSSPQRRNPPSQPRPPPPTTPPIPMISSLAMVPPLLEPAPPPTFTHCQHASALNQLGRKGPSQRSVRLCSMPTLRSVSRREGRMDSREEEWGSGRLGAIAKRMRWRRTRVGTKRRSADRYSRDERRTHGVWQALGRVGGGGV